jgi:hypothetical protein
MEATEILIQEIDSLEKHLNRRRFLKITLLAAVVPDASLRLDDEDFLRRVAATLIPPGALRKTGIDIVSNINHILERGGASHRNKVLRLVAWARRISFLYGGDQVAVRARTSRFVLVRKMGKALTSLCMVSFWGDERSFILIEESDVDDSKN